ncbi:hypothetical protein JCM9279_007242 [Rhodotorula babjevae]
MAARVEALFGVPVANDAQPDPAGPADRRLAQQHDAAQAAAQSPAAGPAPSDSESEPEQDEAGRLQQAANEDLEHRVARAAAAEPWLLPPELRDERTMHAGYADEDTAAHARRFIEDLLRNKAARLADAAIKDQHLGLYTSLKERHLQQRRVVEQATRCSMATETNPPEPFGTNIVFTNAPAALLLNWQPMPGCEFIDSTNASLTLLDRGYCTNSLFKLGNLSAVDRHPHTSHSGRMNDPTYPQRSGKYGFDWRCFNRDGQNCSTQVGKQFDKEALEHLKLRLDSTRGIIVVMGAPNREFVHAELARTGLEIEQTTRTIKGQGDGIEDANIPVWIIRSRTAYERDTGRALGVDERVPITHIISFACHPSYGYYSHSARAKRALYALDVLMYELAISLGVDSADMRFGIFSSFARAPVATPMKRGRLMQWALLEQSEARRDPRFQYFTLEYLEGAEEDDLADLVQQLTQQYAAEQEQVKASYPPVLDSPLQTALSMHRYNESEARRRRGIPIPHTMLVYPPTYDRRNKSVTILSTGAPVAVSIWDRKAFSEPGAYPAPSGGGGIQVGPAAVGMLSSGEPLATAGHMRVPYITHCSACGGLGHKAAQPVCPKYDELPARLCRGCGKAGHRLETCEAVPKAAKKPRVCGICFEPGHRRDGCPRASPSQRRNQTCSVCKQKGHNARVCTNTPVD